MPIARSCNTAADLEAWYPPGHGDFYESFYNAGLLEDFIKQVCVHFCFLSAKINCKIDSYLNERVENIASFLTLIT